MHRDDLMNPDLLSEIVLLGSATLIFITLLASDRCHCLQPGGCVVGLSSSRSDHY